MAESRCGLLCSECEGREEAQCKGCDSMKTPFWSGECGVKSCAEKKGLAHCGQCADFPCDMCANMGREAGFDPAPRLAMCRLWQETEKKN